MSIAVNWLLYSRALIFIWGLCNKAAWMKFLAALRLLSFYFEEKVTQIVKRRGASGLSVKKTWRFICLPYVFFLNSPIIYHIAATGLTTAI